MVIHSCAHGLRPVHGGDDAILRESFCVSVCVSVCLSLCFSVFLYVGLSVCLSVGLSVCLFLSDCLTVSI